MSQNVIFKQIVQIVDTRLLCFALCLLCFAYCHETEIWKEANRFQKYHALLNYCHETEIWKEAYRLQKYHALHLLDMYLCLNDCHI